MLKVRDLRFQYQGQSMIKWPDFEVKGGQPLVILGPSGSGKTTLLQLITGMLRPKGGEIQFLGHPVHQMRAKEIDRLRGQEMGIIFQETPFWASLSLTENLRLAADLSGNSKNISQIVERLGQLDIASLASKKPHECSVGERQRFGIALATIHDPSLVLADEPTSALDDQNCHRVLNMLDQEVVQKNKALILITHDQRVKSVYPNVIDITKA